MMVHSSPLLRQGQLGSTQERWHLQDNSSKTVSGAGGELIHLMMKLPVSTSVVHPKPTGFGMSG